MIAYRASLSFLHSWPGAQADLAQNGQEAIDACRARPYDVVLMDVQMPVCDGLAASRAITARLGPAAPHIPALLILDANLPARPGPALRRLSRAAIALTANAMRGDRERCLEAGMADYLSKPLRVQDLKDALGRARAALAARPPHAACPPAPSPAQPQVRRDT
eukprot:tig00000190_g13859.t1